MASCSNSYSCRLHGGKCGLNTFCRFYLIGRGIDVFAFRPCIKLSANFILGGIGRVGHLFIRSSPRIKCQGSGAFSNEGFFIRPAFNVGFDLYHCITLGVDVTCR